MNKGFKGKDSKIKVMVIPRDDGGCGYYRIMLPYKTLNHHADDIDLMIVDGWHRERIKYIEQADVVVIARLAEQDGLDTLNNVKEKSGCKIVIDHDDNIFAVNPLSPHYKDLGTSEVKVNGMYLWKNGRDGFHIFENLVQLDIATDAMDMVDAVTTTTPILAKRLAAYNKNIHVLPNSVDINKWNFVEKTLHDDSIRLYWAGGHSHYHDWFILHKVLPDLFEEFKQLKLVIKGHHFKGTTKNIPQNRIEVHGWSHVMAYPYESAALKPDIGLIPLAIDEFNQCKSEIKLVEMGALQVPCVVSNTMPYQLFGDDVVYVDNQDDSWYEGVKLLIEDSIMRNAIGANARRTVEDRYSIQSNWTMWHDFIRSLV